MPLIRSLLILLALAPPANLRGEVSGKVTVMGDPGDSRVAAVREAVAFWNSQLDRLDSGGGRLGPVEVIADSVPEDVLSDLSRAVADGRGARGLGRWIQPGGSDFTVVLSQGDLMSFAVPRRGLGGVVVLRRADIPPLSLPNVARNVAAHELGHLLGLPHNNDSGTLMCGRPASCRPDLFASEGSRFFPLTPADEQSLREDFP